MVTVQVRKAPVIYATTKPAPTWAPILDTECEDTINYLGNCYGCNKPEQVGETAQRKLKLRPKLRAAITEDREEKFSASTATRRDTWPKKKNKGHDIPMEKKR